MNAADYAVQMKLIIMNVTGTLVLLSLFFYLHHLQQRWFTKFSIPVLIIILFMITTLVTII